MTMAYEKSRQMGISVNVAGQILDGLEAGSKMSLLKLARAKIEKLENWTQGTRARDMVGTPVEPDSVDAVQWCATGALMAVCGDAYWEERKKLLCATNELFGVGLISLNDHGTHEQVLEAFDVAMAKEAVGC